MRDDHETALVVDARDRLFPAQIARDGVFEKQSDDLPITRADLLADDDTKAIGELAQPQRAFDGVVVGRADDVDAGGAHGAGLVGDLGATIRRSLAVRVHVYANTLRLGSYQAARPVGLASAGAGSQGGGAPGRVAERVSARHGLKAGGFTRLGKAGPRSVIWPFLFKQLVPSALPPRLATGSRLAGLPRPAKPGPRPAICPSFFKPRIRHPPHP